jgi:DNA-binding LytR/AlgR family response regulator
VGNPGTAIISEPLQEELEEAVKAGQYTIIVFRIRGLGASDGRAKEEQGESRFAVVTDAGEDSQRVALEYVRRLFSNDGGARAVRIVPGPTDGLGLDPAEELMERPPSKESVRPAKIAVRTEGKIVFVNPGDVRVIEAQGNYVLLQTASASHSLRESISTVADKLEPYGFVRIHRSTIVNASAVEEIRTSPSGEIRVCLKGSNKEYSVSRRYRAALQSIAPCWI